MESQRTRPSRPLLKHALAGLIAASLPLWAAAQTPPPKESDAESRAKKAAESPLKLILQSATIIREKPKDPPKPAAPAPAPVAAAAAKPAVPANDPQAAALAAKALAERQQAAAAAAAKPADAPPAGGGAAAAAPAVAATAVAPAASVGLSAEEQALKNMQMLHDLGSQSPGYESEADSLQVVSGDVPEVPARVLREVGEGSVKVRFTVDVSGLVSVVDIRKSTNRKLNSYVQDAVKAWRFMPMRASQTGEIEFKFAPTE